MTANDYVVPVFPGEHDERTCAAGFLSDDGDKLVLSIHEPDVIDAVASRLHEIAHEIRYGKTVPYSFDNVVRGVDWGSNDSPEH
ncbi:hypothetical protein [Leucobacter sp. G161]|uniref:hypothetical protein n=1 Tax=Leucobacter sp. G161 TaxID=663704 RepID=UPI00128F8355|nr:hypothetical protein [Leucobacter sp. G161]